MLAGVAAVTAFGCSSDSASRRAKSPQLQGQVAEPEPLPPLNVLQRLRGGEEERRACFAASGRGVDGFVKLVWDIDPDGKVTEVGVEGSSVHEAAIEKCLSKAVSQLDFGPRQEPSRARWTFVHHLPKMPGADEALATQKKSKKRKQKKQDADDGVAGVSIEKASPGSLDLQRIEDIVYAGFPLFAYCYRAGLERNPELGGLVRLRFVIDEVGQVMGVMDNGSEFGDKNALDCMAEGIFALSFPAPRGGDVRVQYRIVFESG